MYWNGTRKSYDLNKDFNPGCFGSCDDDVGIEGFVLLKSTFLLFCEDKTCL